MIQWVNEVNQIIEKKFTHKINFIRYNSASPTTKETTMAKKEQVDIAVELRTHIARKYKTQRAAAKAWNVSGAFVSLVLTEKKAPTETMLEDAGFKRVAESAHYVKA